MRNVNCFSGWLCFLCLFLVFVSGSKYRSNAEIEQYFVNYTNRFAGMARYYSIGESNKGTKLWVMLVSTARKGPGIPNVKLIANIHGNEPVGREILLEFLEYLATNYGKDQRITWLLNNTRIHIMPTLNPDGFDVALMDECNGSQGRENGAKINLNRNFPDYFHETKSPQQPETTAVMKWMNDTSFVLSASLHGGAVVANYPFDSEEMQKWQRFLRMYLESSRDDEDLIRQSYIASLPYNPPSLTPDDDVFKYLARTYANAHENMYRGISCQQQYDFKGGITNGAEWYTFTGGMQDYNYAMSGCMELTLELSCCKYPRADKLPMFWEENKEALLKFCLQAHQGVKGVILDAKTMKGLPSVQLKIRDRKIGFKTSKDGEFWRILLPGSYYLEITHPASNKMFSVPFTIFEKSTELSNPVNITIFLGQDNVSFKTDPFVKDVATITTTHRTPKIIKNSTNTTATVHSTPLAVLDISTFSQSLTVANFNRKSSYCLSFALVILLFILRNCSMC